MAPERVAQRYLNSLQPEGECLVTGYAVGSHGYPQIGWWENRATRSVLCHRLAYVIAYGFIPEGQTVDHLCRNRRCGNPEHLRLLSNVENGRMNGNWAKQHCPQGHPYSPENTSRRSRGGRECRTCINAREARRRPRKKIA